MAAGLRWARVRRRVLRNARLFLQHAFFRNPGKAFDPRRRESRKTHISERATWIREAASAKGAAFPQETCFRKATPVAGLLPVP